MTIIDRYIVRTFLSGYAILMLVGIGLYILSGLLLNLDEFTQDTDLPAGQVLLKIAEFYGTNITLYYSQLAGPLMAIAAAFTFATMLKNNELTALVAAGMPLQRLLVPVVACGLLLVGVWVVNREIIMPPLAPKLARGHDDVLGQRTQGVFARDENDVIVTALRLYPEAGRMERVFLMVPDQTGTPTHMIEADAAVWDATRRTWRLERGARYVVADDSQQGIPAGTVIKKPIDEYPVTLSPAQLSLRQHAQWADYLSLRQLNALLASRNLPNWPSVSLTRHVRLTQPIFQVVLLLLAVPFLLTRERGNVLAAGGRALLVTGAFFLLTFVAHNVVKDAAHAAFFVWFPIFVFGPVAVLQIANIRT